MKTLELLEYGDFHELGARWLELPLKHKLKIFKKLTCEFLKPECFWDAKLYRRIWVTDSKSQEFFLGFLSNFESGVPKSTDCRSRVCRTCTGHRLFWKPGSLARRTKLLKKDYRSLSKRELTELNTYRVAHVHFHPGSIYVVGHKTSGYWKRPF